MASYSFNKQGQAYKRPASTNKLSNPHAAFSPTKTQDDFYNSGMPGENPFMSMYQATISAQGATRAQTSHGGARHKTPIQRSQKAHHATPGAGRNTKSESKFGTILKHEQSRKFGEYEGGEAAEALFAPGIWGESPCKLQLSAMFNF